MSLRPGDVEAAFVTILSAIDRAHVGTKTPNPRPPYSIRVTRAGGNRRNLVQERPLMVLECWGPDSVAAFELAADAWAAINDADGTVVAGVAIDLPRDSLASPINMPDPDTSNPRYQFTCQVYARLSEDLGA